LNIDNRDDLREFLKIMAEFGISQCEAGGMKFTFGIQGAANVLSAESGEERIDRLKKEFMDAAKDSEESDLWST
jgi:hypothetical protein